MPKRRDGKAHDVVFSVSPWQDKAAHSGGDAEAAPGGELYSVVTVPLVVGAGGGAGGRAGGGLAAGPQQHGRADAPSRMAVDAAPPAATATAAAPVAGAWQAKKRKPAEEAAAPAAAPSPPPALQPARGAVAGEPDAAAAAAAQPTVLEGTAYLALLPNGSVTGHLVCAPSMLAGGGRRRSFGLMAELVVAGRECTRDSDWGVLRVTVVNFGAGGSREVSFLAEKTEGDAMRLRAPVPWQGVELGEAPALEAACSCPSTAPGLALDFRCDQLLTGAAGEAMLARLQPSLVGEGAAVNVGEMRLSLPPDAASELLGAAAAVPAAPVPTPARGSGGAGGGAAPGGGAQRQQQRRLTGAGSGGAGRVLQDSGDDWRLSAGNMSACQRPASGGGGAAAATPRRHRQALRCAAHALAGDQYVGKQFSVLSTSEDATAHLAALLAGEMRAGDALCLKGDPGAGKTAFSRAFVRAASGNPGQDVPPPQAGLRPNEYRGTGVLPAGEGVGELPVLHWDVGGLQRPSDGECQQLTDTFPYVVSLIEWAETLREWGAAPEQRLALYFRRVPSSPDSDARIITVVPHTGWWEVRAALLQAKLNGTGMDAGLVMLGEDMAAQMLPGMPECAMAMQ